MGATWDFEKRSITDDLSVDVVESLVFGAARQAGGVYGQRLLVRIVMEAQKWFRPIDFKDRNNMCQVEVGKWGDAKLTFSLRDFMPAAKANNYTAVKAALSKLLKLSFFYEIDNKLVGTNVLTKVVLDNVPGKVTISVNRDIWDTMLNFSKGYLAYNPHVALSLKSECALFFYKRLANQKNPMVFSIDDLKKQFGLENKYERTSDFLKRVIEPAKAELDQKSPYSFTIVNDPADKNRKRAAHMTTLTIVPVRRFCNETDDDARKEVHPMMLIGKDNYHMLCETFQFEPNGIKANIKLFDTIVKKQGADTLRTLLESLINEARKASSPQGYVINATKAVCKNIMATERSKQPVCNKPHTDVQTQKPSSSSHTTSNRYSEYDLNELLTVREQSYIKLGHKVPDELNEAITAKQKNM